MNGEPLASTSSSSFFNLSSNCSKSKLLSSYFISDDEEDDNFVKEQVGETENDRIEVLTSSSSNHNILVDQRSDSADSNSNRAVEDTNASHSRSKSLDKTNNIWSDDTIGSSTPRRSQYRITFEIIKAKTVSNYEKGISRNRFEGKKYVNYTILIKRVPGLETQPAIIERRYSQFLTFYNSIKKKYPLLLKDIVFPKKIFIGNFSAEVIAERSLSFQRFLSYCLSVSEIRSSKDFASFLFYPELNEAKKYLQTIRLEEAASIFENIYFIQDKLAIHSGKPNAQLIHTLCCLIGCLNAVDNTAEAKKLADRTFEMLFENSVILTPNNRNCGSVYELDNLYESSELVLPLILLSLRLQWFSGQRKLALEDKLEELCCKRNLPRNFDSQPTLLEIILRRDFSLVLE